MIRNLLFIVVFIACFTPVNAQLFTPEELSYNEYLGYVKKYHPSVKQADLQLTMAQANLMQSRGAFDPKIEVDYSQKEFKSTNYYSLLNSSFKIPTWYGIEVKAAFDNSEGIFLNPQLITPTSGLTSLGINVPLGQGLFINQRMADLKKARLQIQLSQSERKLMAVEVLYKASIAYFNWLKTYKELLLYESYYDNAQRRYKGIVSLIEQGDKPSIDSTEAGIVVKNRQLNLEDAKLKLIKTKLEVSNFLWLDDGIPMELSNEIQPEIQIVLTIDNTLKTNELLTNEFNIIEHPKVKAIESKLNMLDVDRRLKANMLLPKIDIGYHYLSEPNTFTEYKFDNYKVGVNFYYPLFLRKERGSLKLAKFKVQDTELSLAIEKQQITNKVKAQQTEIVSLQRQNKMIDALVKDYTIMLNSEERLFSFGESSMFLINSRENSLVTSQLNQINLENRYCISNADLFKIIANPD